jgi:site-specific DNA recombinase
VPAPEIEAVVLQEFRRVQGSTDTGPVGFEQIATWLDRVVVRQGSIELVPKGEGAGESFSIVVPWSPPPRRRRRELTAMPEPGVRPTRPAAQARLVEGIAKARGWLEEIMSGRADTHALAAREGCSERSVRQTLNLAFLAPEVVKAAVEGALPDEVGLVRLVNAPVSWSAQCANSAPLTQPSLSS